jgi:16S rRNA (uracil1498-N3)-methyltransferase
MKRFYLNEKLEVNKDYYIEGIEHNHIKNVMRMVEGDEIIIVCGDDYDYQARIEKITKGDTLVRIIERTQNIYNPTADVTVFQALVKSDNMSLIIQKLTELGIKSFVPFESEFITSKDKFGKKDKMQEISNQSIKQCKRSIPMNVLNVITFDEMVKDLCNFDTIIFANECEKTASLKDININAKDKVAIIIGSEGGFSEKEINKIIGANGKSISLGKRILRAETAAIALASVIMCKMGEWDYE